MSARKSQRRILQNVFSNSPCRCSFRTSNFLTNARDRLFLKENFKRLKIFHCTNKENIFRRILLLHIIINTTLFAVQEIIIYYVIQYLLQTSRNVIHVTSKFNLNFSLLFCNNNFPTFRRYVFCIECICIFL